MKSLIAALAATLLCSPVAAESMDLLQSLEQKERARVIFIHMNHTNPLLADGSPEQAEVERRGFRFAREGMRLKL